mmetsp:Transcript_14282/g.26224  ORF Transcript_14282/g.26224 Transcript_14282/m.26224 type:complete len:207 (+) Transcript_14282:17788-18408(+)
MGADKLDLIDIRGVGSKSLNLISINRSGCNSLNLIEDLISGGGNSLNFIHSSDDSPDGLPLVGDGNSGSDGLFLDDDTVSFDNNTLHLVDNIHSLELGLSEGGVSSVLDKVVVDALSSVKGRSVPRESDGSGGSDRGSSSRRRFSPGIGESYESGGGHCDRSGSDGVDSRNTDIVRPSRFKSTALKTSEDVPSTDNIASEGRVDTD